MSASTAQTPPSPWRPGRSLKRPATTKPAALAVTVGPPETARQREYRGAFLNFLAVFLGALVAASAGVAGPMLLQARQDHRDQRRELTQAQGAARVLQSEMAQSAAQMAVLWNDRILGPFDAGYRIDVRAEDMRLIASHLSADEWGMVIKAIASVDGLATFVKTQLERGRRKLTEGRDLLLRARLDVDRVRHPWNGTAGERSGASERAGRAHLRAQAWTVGLSRAISPVDPGQAREQPCDAARAIAGVAS